MKQRKSNSFALVIFGSTGDLMRRKLMPALYRLRTKNALGDFFVVGVGRRDLSVNAFRQDMERTLHDIVGRSFDRAVWDTIACGIIYERGFFEDPTLYKRLHARLTTFDRDRGACLPRFFYLATPPVHYEVIMRNVDKSGLARGCGHRGHFSRILIEKPFGSDIRTARMLEVLLTQTFDEQQIYRVDHYLGKETVQNMLSFRFANGIFEPTWNREFVDHVQIALLEKEGVGTRGASYDGVGAIRDVVQNHMLQMLALTAMEQPAAFDAESIRDRRSQAIAAIAPIAPEDVGARTLRGQYIGYTTEDGVAFSSRTETFACLKLLVENDRWRGVPFYLRTGKKLGKNVTEISIHYKKPAVCAGDACLFPEAHVLRNVLSIRIQPDDGVSLRVMVKKPGFEMRLSPTQMTFHYREQFADFREPEAYEKLLLDAIAGDQTLFARTDGVMASWRVAMEILDGWAERRPAIHQYPAGSMGPNAGDAFITRDGRRWFLHDD